jgi:hypothetical protein
MRGYRLLAGRTSANAISRDTRHAAHPVRLCAFSLGITSSVSRERTWVDHGNGVELLVPVRHKGANMRRLEGLCAQVNLAFSPAPGGARTLDGATSFAGVLP